jgi:Immunity protein 50
MDQPPVPVVHAARLLDAFDYWPSFHDAEIHQAVLDRGSRGGRLSVTLVLNAYDSSGAVDARGYYDVRVNVMVTLRFSDVADLELRDLNSQNVLSELVLECQASGRIAVELGHCWGLAGVFTCADIEVVDVQPRSPDVDDRPSAPASDVPDADA